jgi:DNA-binding response OmpR family regulator
LQFLQDALEDCQVIYCPDGAHARPFIERISYSLLLFDERLPDTTGAELKRFTRSLPRRERTPVIIIKDSDNFDSLREAIKNEIVKEQRID